MPTKTPPTDTPFEQHVMTALQKHEALLTQCLERLQQISDTTARLLRSVGEPDDDEDE